MPLVLGINELAMNSLTKLFVPGGKKFHELFEQVAANLKQMATLFAEHAVTTDRMKRRVLLEKIERLENKNDDATHKLFVELGRNFITPFDREDIHFMATSLDNVADMIWSVAKQMYHYDITETEATVKQVADGLLKFTALLADCLHGLRNRKGLNALITMLEEMRKLTYQCEQTITTSLAELFDEKANPVELIKLSDHYNMLQALNNKCSDVINVMEGVIIKYG